MAAGERKVYADVSEAAETFELGSAASDAAADYIVDAFERMREAIADAEEELAKIDGVAGDGDHGRGMVKGSTFAAEAAKAAREKGAAAGSVLREAGRAWAAKAGGTSGVLWGSALEAAGAVVGDHADAYDADIAAEAVKAAYEKMLSLGGAHRGDKTMLDALIPFGEALEEQAAAGKSLKEAWANAAEVAKKAAEDTANMVPKVGRARPAAERSLGTPDAGAISMALCIRTVLPKE